MEILIYLGVLILIAGVAIGSVWLKRKFNINKDDMEFLKLILELVDFVAGKFEYKFKESVKKVVEYVLEATIFVIAFEDIYTIEEGKNLIFDKAKEICFTEGIDIDNELESIIYELVTYIVDNKLTVEEVK